MVYALKPYQDSTNGCAEPEGGKGKGEGGKGKGGIPAHGINRIWLPHTTSRLDQYTLMLFVMIGYPPNKIHNRSIDMGRDAPYNIHRINPPDG